MLLAVCVTKAFFTKRIVFVVLSGMLSSMRNLKTEVTSIKKDQQCGLKFDDMSVTFQPGDIIQSYRTYHVPQEVDWNPF